MPVLLKPRCLILDRHQACPYKNTGDHPATYRYKLEYEYRKNILSLRFRYGVYDNLYDSFSVGYIRCF